MKRNLFLVIIALLSLVFIVGCHKDPLDMGKVGLLRLEVKKGYKTMNKGAVESFYATVTVAYVDNDDVVYNCLFTDPNNTGVYTNDINEGDRLYVRKNEEFQLIIETDIDGYHVVGESGKLVYSDDMDLSTIEIVLRAGQTRIAIYSPKSDEIFGNYVVAYGEIIENVSQNPIREAGIMLVAKSVYDTYESSDVFTFENESNASGDWITEYYYSGGHDDGDVSSVTKFSVVLRGLEPNTRYCMRAFTFSEGSDSAFSYCYSRVVEFSTNNNVAHDISVVTNDADNVTIESVDVAGRVVLLDGNSADSIMEMGFAFDTYDNYVSNSSNLDYYRNNSFLFPASDVITRDDVIVFSSTVEGLHEGGRYVFRAYAIFRDQPYYGTVKMFAVPQNPENIRIQADEIESVLTSSYVDLQGSIINDANYEFSEIGFKYVFIDNGATPPTTISELTETARATVMSGSFSSRVNLPIVNKIMYFAPYAITTTGYTAYGDISSAVSIEPANVPRVTLSQDNLSTRTTHSMTVSCYVDANGRSDCECGIVFAIDTTDHASYDTVKKVSSSNGTEEFILNGLRKGTTYTYWAYVRVVDEYITTNVYSATTLQEGEIGPGGGVIFYADDVNSFALEYFISEGMGQDTERGDSAIWGSTAGIALNIDAPSSITVSGRANTEAIVSYHNSIGFTDEYAALKCYRSTQGGKSDWYLPTSVEMQALIDYIANSGENDLYSEYGGFWTSDEQNAGNAVAFIQNQQSWTYEQGTMAKNSLLNFVQIRRF